MGVISKSLATPLDVKMLLPFRQSGRNSLGYLAPQNGSTDAEATLAMTTDEHHLPEARPSGYVAASGRGQSLPRWWKCILNFALVLWIIRVPLAMNCPEFSGGYFY